MTEKNRPSSKLDATAPDVACPDERLVSQCLQGDERAWSALIDRYKNLIFSIPIKYGASREDAADLFQAVCLELFSELPKLRKAGALRSWLMTITIHKAFHWKKKQRRQSDVEMRGMDQEHLEKSVPESRAFIEELEREQMVRDAVTRLPARCREMIRLLFYEQPPIPYNELSQRLGLATGYIGFIRGRCLKRLQRVLDDMGFV